MNAQLFNPSVETFREIVVFSFLLCFYCSTNFSANFLVKCQPIQRVATDEMTAQTCILKVHMRERRASNNKKISRKHKVILNYA